MEARLTESFLTNKTSQQQHGHVGPSRALFPTTDRHASSTTRSVTSRHDEFNVHSSSSTNTSYQLHTVGHNAGSGSLRVTKANSNNMSSSSNF
jgi:hypothetical protein